MKSRSIYLFSILLILSNFVYAQELPKLKSGIKLRNIFMERTGYTWDSGFSIYEFRVNEQGLVDSVTAINKYYNLEYKDLVKGKTEDVIKLIKGFEFEPQEKAVWIQSKVTVFYYDYRNPDPENKKLNNDRMRRSPHGFDELWENEISTFFTNEEKEVKDFIYYNGKYIIAPIYLKAAS